MNELLTQRTQRGAALIVGLIFTVVASIVAMSSMRGSQMQESMTANLNNKAVSFMAAEAGSVAFWTWLSDEWENGTLDWENSSWRNGWTQSVPQSSSGSPNAGTFGFFWIDPASISWNPDDVNVVVTGYARTGTDSVLAETRLGLVFTRPQSGGVNPAFLAGLLADGDIDINGNATLTGSAHANGSFDVSGGNSNLNNRSGVDEDGNNVTIVSTVSGHGSASMSGGGVDQANVLSTASRIDVPSASQYISDNQNSAGVINSCSIPSGDLGGAIYFCDGNATTSGNFSNVTVMAIGNVTHNGSAQLGGSGSTLTVAIIAGGNITINGSNNTYGVFWADGNVRQNGASTLGGSVIAGGDITRNGVFNYTQYDDFGALDLPTAPPVPLAINSWREIQ